MASDGFADRIAIGTRASGITFADLGSRSRRAGTYLADLPGQSVVLVDENSPALPLALFGSAVGGKRFVPVNYRLADDQLRAVVERCAPAVVIAGAGVAERLAGLHDIHVISRHDFLVATLDVGIAETDGWGCDPDEIAVLLFTSGTTGEPKAAVLRHRNLAAYLVGSLEFGAASTDDAALISVPPYHIASVSSVLSNAYLGRRTVQLASFDPVEWVAAVREQSITSAMVVPTMLNRILDVVAGDGEGLPALRSLAYGGGPMSMAVVEQAMNLLPGLDLVNAYGLTETSSTIAVLGPEHHREAFGSADPEVRKRLGSVGRPLPNVEVRVCDADGNVVAPGERGEIRVRGDQVSGEYLGSPGVAADDWFRTRDSGHIDAQGFLFVDGRLDDVIVRGGENLSPGEIESALLEHPSVRDVAVVGIPDAEWGECVVAAVSLEAGETASEDQLRSHVRSRLRSARTPQRVQFVAELPYSDTGKLLRRVIRHDLSQAFAGDTGD